MWAIFMRNWIFSLKWFSTFRRSYTLSKRREPSPKEQHRVSQKRRLEILKSYTLSLSLSLSLSVSFSALQEIFPW
jgi:hypothetical protein